MTQQSSKNSITEAALRALIGGDPAVSVEVLGGERGFRVRMAIGSASYELASSRGQSRVFASIDTVALFLRGLGVPRFAVDVSDYRAGRIRGARPDRAAALRGVVQK